MRIPQRLAKMVHGNRRLARVFRPVANRMLPSKITTVTVFTGVGAGIKLLIDPQREKFYWTGAHEPAVQTAIRSRLRSGDVFWDVGAHVGFFTLIGSRAVGPLGQVHAFEPDAANRARLAGAVSLNDVSNVSIHPIAIADRDGPALMHTKGSSLMWSVVSEVTPFAQMVQCSKLDSLGDIGGVPRLVKLDVEGAELLALSGATRLLAAGHCDFIVEFLKESHVEQTQARWPQYRFQRLDEKNWLMTSDG